MVIGSGPLFFTAMVQVAVPPADIEIGEGDLVRARSKMQGLQSTLRLPFAPETAPEAVIAPVEPDIAVAAIPVGTGEAGAM